MAERNDNNNDSRIAGNRGFTTPDFGTVILKLDNTLSSFTSQMSILTKALQEQQKQLSSITSSNEKFYRDFTKSNKPDMSSRNRSFDGRSSSLRNIGSLASDIEEFRKEITLASRQVKQEAKSWKYTDRSFKGVGSDIVSARRRQQVMEDFSKMYEDQQRYIEQRLSMEQQLHTENMKQIESQFDKTKNDAEIRELRQKINSLVSKRKEATSLEEKQKITEEIKQIQPQVSERLNKEKKYESSVKKEDKRYTDQIATIQEDASESINNLARSRDRLLLEIDKMFIDIEQAFEQAQDGVNSVRNRSLSMNKYMEDLEASKEEKFNDAVEQAREQISDSMSVLQKKLDADAEQTDERLKLTDDERENIKKQLEILKKEEDYLRKLTPLTDVWRDAGNKIKDTIKDGIFGSIDSFVKNIEDRYLSAYIEGFQNVYNSIESTRNSISARLKLNSGDYKEMQETLAAEIQTRGLAGSVSMTDVDDMLVSLQSAGITDQAMLQELAIEGAKLKAQGSSLDLGNEETLQQVMQMYSSSMRQGATTDEALSAITNMMDEVAATEVYTRQQFGYDAALVNGGLNTIFNQAAKMGVSSGKSISQITSDIGSSAFASQALYSSGIDESLIRQSIQSIFDNTVADSDVFSKMLISGGLSRDQLMGMDMGQAMQYVTSRMDEILQNADPKYIAEIGKAYALPGNVTDWLNMQQHEGSFNVTPSDNFQDSIDQIIEADNLALEQGDYLSRTAQVTKEYENKMTGQAIEAEQLYKGDQAVVGQLQNISNTINSIYSIIKGGVVSSLDSIRKGGLEAFGRKGTETLLGTGVDASKGISTLGQALSQKLGVSSFEQGAGQFLLGKSGTALGTAGKIAGGAVGAAWMIDSITDNIGETFQESFENIGTDPQFYRGLGTTLGSAIAGPVGGAIGGVIGQASSQLGNWIADKITSDMDVNDAQMEAAERLMEAGNSLNDSAKKHAEEIKNAQQNILNQKEIFNDYDENMQKQFITQMDIDTTGMSNQEAFQKAIQKWEQIELRKIEEMNLKQQAAENTSILQAAMGKQIDGSLFEASKDVQQKQIEDLVESKALSADVLDYINQYGLDSLSESQRNIIDEAWKQKEEKRTDLQKIQTQQGYDELALIEEQALRNYAEQNKLYDASGAINIEDVKKQVKSKGAKLDYESATKQLYSEQLKEGSITSQDISTMTDYYTILADNRQMWEQDNQKFQNQWTTIQNKNPGASIVDLVDAYNKEYLDGKGISVSDVIEGFSVDSVGLSAQYTKDENGLPSLRSTSKSGSRMYDPSIYHGKFETGLTEVPFDMYPALLHEGERVLTKEEADAYNELSSYAVSKIANQTSNVSNSTNYFSSASSSLDTINSCISDQTRKEEKLLSSILEALNILIQETRNNNNRHGTINKNILNMNSNKTALNTSI